MGRLALICFASALALSSKGVLAGELDQCVTLRDVEVPKDSPPAKTPRIPRLEPVQVLGHYSDATGGKEQANAHYSQDGFCKVRHGTDPYFPAPLSSLTSRFGACLCPSEEQLKELSQREASWLGLEGMRVLLWRRLRGATSDASRALDWEECYLAYVNTEPADAEVLAAVQSDSVSLDTPLNQTFLARLYSIDNERAPQNRGRSTVQFLIQSSEERAQLAKVLQLHDASSLDTIPVALDPKHFEVLSRGTVFKTRLFRDAFYWFKPKEKADDTDWRVYVHVAHDHALDVVQYLIKNVVDARKFNKRLGGFKVAAPSLAGIRADSIVIYAKDYGAADEIANLLKVYQQTPHHLEHFKSSVPLMTEELPGLKGVSLAQEPDAKIVAAKGTPMSFGSLRCRALADALESLLKETGGGGQLKYEQFRERSDSNLRRDRIDPANPARNLK
jgi:hypothetical protein